MASPNEEVCEAISIAMEEKDISTADIPQTERGISPSDVNSIKNLKSKRYFLVKGEALFKQHGQCSRTWTSAHAWATIDLKKQAVIHKYNQNCNRCECSCEAHFTDEGLERMAEWATERYLVRSGRATLDVSSLGDALPALPHGRGPHDVERCEMCRELGRECWL